MQSGVPDALHQRLTSGYLPPRTAAPEINGRDDALLEHPFGRALPKQAPCTSSSWHVEQTIFRLLRPTVEELIAAGRWATTHDPTPGFRGHLVALLRMFGVESAKQPL